MRDFCPAFINKTKRRERKRKKKLAVFFYSTTLRMFNRFLLVLVAVISSVTAHVTVTPATMVSGAKYQTLTFRIGHACNVNTSVTSLSIQLPPQEQVTAFKSSFIYGWKQNITLGGNATWSATSNEFYMPNSNFLDLPVSFSLGNFSADTNMTFYIAQSKLSIKAVYIFKGFTLFPPIISFCIQY